MKAFWMWDLPKASRIWESRFARAVLDNWQLSGIATFVSGAPLGISLSFSPSRDITGSPTDGPRVVVAGDPTLPKDQRTLEHHFNTNAILAPGRGTAGNAPKDVIRGPGINNVDLSLFKNIPLHSERWKLQFRASFITPSITPNSEMSIRPRDSMPRAGKSISALANTRVLAHRVECS